MLNPLLILATLMFSSPSHAEDRAVAAATAPTAEASIYNEQSARSFFEPKSEADINALATLDKELTASLDQEILK